MSYPFHMDGQDADQWDGWPASLRELADIIGDKAALELQGARAGTRMYVPKRPTQKSPLAQIIGLREARLLAVSGYGGEYLVVPTGVLMKARVRRRAIEAAEGFPSDVARRFGVSERWVRKIRQQGKIGAPA